MKSHDLESRILSCYYSGNKIPQSASFPRRRESTKDWIPYHVLNDIVDMFICRSNITGSNKQVAYLYSKKMDTFQALSFLRRQESMIILDSGSSPE